jgi:hypothetical protein
MRRYRGALLEVEVVVLTTIVMDVYRREERELKQESWDLEECGIERR